MSTHQTVRRVILTGSIAAVTVTGTLYGAGWKGDREVAREKKRRLEATPDEVIAQLEMARADLVSKKNEMERKINAFTERRRVKEMGQQETK